MTIKTEPILTGEFILSLASGQRSKAQITVKSGEDLNAGYVLAKETTAAGTAAGAADAGNTGDGAMGAVTVSADAKVGLYAVTFLEPGLDAGDFQVEDPDGINVGTGSVAEVFTGGGVSFTMADGATDFVAGDRFVITVAQATEKWVALPDDGSDQADGILYADIDASLADVEGVAVVRDAEVKSSMLTWPSGISADNKDLATQQLAARGIIIR